MNDRRVTSEVEREHLLLKRFQKQMLKSKAKRNKFQLSDSEDEGLENMQGLGEAQETDKEQKPREFLEEGGEEEEGGARKLSKKEKLERIIAKSKLQKNERALMKEEHLNMASKLNEEFKEVAKLLKKREKGAERQQDSD